MSERCEGMQMINLGKSFQTSIFLAILAKYRFDTAENELFNFHNFSSPQGFNFHRAVVSPRTVLGPWYHFRFQSLSKLLRRYASEPRRRCCFLGREVRLQSGNVRRSKIIAPSLFAKSNDFRSRLVLEIYQRSVEWTKNSL